MLRGREPNIAEQFAADPVATLDTSNAIKEILRAALRAKPTERTQSVAEFCVDLYTAFTRKVIIRRDTPIREAARGIAQGDTVRQAQGVAHTKAREKAARQAQANGAVVEADSQEKVAFQARGATEKPNETARRAQEAAEVKAEPVAAGPHIRDDEAVSRRISRIIIGTPAVVLLIVILRITLWSTTNSITASSSPTQTAQPPIKPIQVESPATAEDHQGNQADAPETSHSASEEAPIESSDGVSPVALSPNAKKSEATKIVAKKGKTVARRGNLTIAPPLTQALLKTQLDALEPDEIQCFRDKKAELGTEVKFIIKVSANGKIEPKIISRHPGTEAYCISNIIRHTPISTPPMTDVTLQHTSTYLIR